MTPAPVRSSTLRGAKPLDQDQFIGRIKAAEVLDVDPQTIDKLIRQGQLVANKIGRSVLVRKDSLQTLISRTQMEV